MRNHRRDRWQASLRGYAEAKAGSCPRAAPDGVPKTQFRPAGSDPIGPRLTFADQNFSCDGAVT